MKQISIASSTDNVECVRRVAEMLQRLGHAVTCDWFSEKVRKPDGMLKEMNHVALATMGINEINGVMNCDICLALMPGGNGTHFELGMAYGMKKKIIIFDPCLSLLKSTTTFHHTFLKLDGKGVTVTDDIETVWKEIND